MPTIPSNPPPPPPPAPKGVPDASHDLQKNLNTLALCVDKLSHAHAHDFKPNTRSRELIDAVLHEMADTAAILIGDPKLAPLLLNLSSTLLEEHPSKKIDTLNTIVNNLFTTAQLKKSTNTEAIHTWTQELKNARKEKQPTLTELVTSTGTATPKTSTSLMGRALAATEPAALIQDSGQFIDLAKVTLDSIAILRDGLVNKKTINEDGFNQALKQIMTVFVSHTQGSPVSLTDDLNSVLGQLTNIANNPSSLNASNLDTILPPLFGIIDPNIHTQVNASESSWDNLKKANIVTTDPFPIDIAIQATAGTPVTPTNKISIPTDPESEKTARIQLIQLTKATLDALALLSDSVNTNQIKAEDGAKILTQIQNLFAGFVDPSSFGNILPGQEAVTNFALNLSNFTLDSLRNKTALLNPYYKIIQTYPDIIQAGADTNWTSLLNAHVVSGSSPYDLVSAAQARQQPSPPSGGTTPTQPPVPPPSGGTPPGPTPVTPPVTPSTGPSGQPSIPKITPVPTPQPVKPLPDTTIPGTYAFSYVNKSGVTDDKITITIVEEPTSTRPRKIITQKKLSEFPGIEGNRTINFAQDHTMRIYSEVDRGDGHPLTDFVEYNISKKGENPPYDFVFFNTTSVDGINLPFAISQTKKNGTTPKTIGMAYSRQNLIDTIREVYTKAGGSWKTALDNFDKNQDQGIPSSLHCLNNPDYFNTLQPGKTKTWMQTFKDTFSQKSILIRTGGQIWNARISENKLIFRNGAGATITTTIPPTTGQFLGADPSVWQAKGGNALDLLAKLVAAVDSNTLPTDGTTVIDANYFQSKKAQFFQDNPSSPLNFVDLYSQTLTKMGIDGHLYTFPNSDQLSIDSSVALGLDDFQYGTITLGPIN